MSGMSHEGGVSDPGSMAGTNGGEIGRGETDPEPIKGARDNFLIRMSDGEEGPSRRAVSWSVRGDNGKSRRPVIRRTCSSSRVILGMAIYNSGIYTIITSCF